MRNTVSARSSISGTSARSPVVGRADLGPAVDGDAQGVLEPVREAARHDDVLAVGEADDQALAVAGSPVRPAEHRQLAVDTAGDGDDLVAADGLVADAQLVVGEQQRVRDPRGVDDERPDAEHERAAEQPARQVGHGRAQRDVEQERARAGSPPGPAGSRYERAGS